MNLRIRLYPPLNNTAGRDQLQLSLGESATIQVLIDELVDRFGPEFRRHLYDDRDRFIPAWCAFINNRAVHLNQPAALETSLSDGDEVSLILALAGG